MFWIRYSCFSAICSCVQLRTSDRSFSDLHFQHNPSYPKEVPQLGQWYYKSIFHRSFHNKKALHLRCQIGSIPQGMKNPGEKSCFYHDFFPKHKIFISFLHFCHLAKVTCFFHMAKPLKKDAIIHFLLIFRSLG